MNHRIVHCVIHFIILCFLSIVHAQSPKKTYLTIMTFNIENGGTQVDFKQVVNAIKKAKADVVGLQEAWGNSKRVAKALNWNYYDPRHHIISRFPLFRISGSSCILIEIKPRHFISMANIHLPDTSYGPELIQQGFSAAQVASKETTIRLAEAKSVINDLNSLAKQGIPAFLTGDFNSPSHSDWTELTLHKQQNHRYVMNWPVTQYLVSQNFIDSYRHIHPNPYKHPGITWPAARPYLKDSIDGYNPSSSDLPDRIDFIFSSGPAQVIDSQLLGENKITPWPSDHRAVVSRFKIIPSEYPIHTMKLIPIIGEYQSKKPKIHAPSFIASGQSIPISWNNAPGYSYDYISISPSTNKDSSQAVRLYTLGKIDGVIHYTDTNVEGNRILWNRTSTAHWPLTPGTYTIQLMLDDGLTSLAATKLVITPFFKKETNSK